MHHLKGGAFCGVDFVTDLLSVFLVESEGLFAPLISHTHVCKEIVGLAPRFPHAFPKPSRIEPSCRVLIPPGKTKARLSSSFYLFLWSRMDWLSPTFPTRIP